MKKTLFELLGFSYIGNVNSSSKILKTSKKLEIDTYVMYLAPSSLSGYNVCPMATSECIKGCLNTSGRAKMDTTYKMMTRARIAKTKYFYEYRNEFNRILFKEIETHKRRTLNRGNDFAVRLNGTSDISPVLLKVDNKNVLETYPDITFYDYTKVLNRIELTKKYPNYDLTFSYTGYNWNEAEKALQNNVRVAVVFNIPKSGTLPKTFKGVKVIDGDSYDYRPFDAKNVIVGLRWKNIRKKKINKEIKNSLFVVQSESADCSF